MNITKESPQKNWG